MIIVYWVTYCVGCFAKSGQPSTGLDGDERANASENCKNGAAAQFSWH